MKACTPFASTVLAFILVATLYPTFARTALAGDIYRWQDERGVTHYSSSPPEGRDVVKMKPALAPTPEMHEAAKRSARREVEQAKRALSDRHDTAAAEAAREKQRDADQARRVERCGFARQQLGVLTKGGPVSSRDEQGNKVYLDDSERDREIARARRDAEQACRGVDPDTARSTAERADQQLVTAENCLELRGHLREFQRSGSRIGDQEIQRIREAMDRACGTTP